MNIYTDQRNSVETGSGLLTRARIDNPVYRSVHNVHLKTFDIILKKCVLAGLKAYERGWTRAQRTSSMRTILLFLQIFHMFLD